MKCIVILDNKTSNWVKTYFDKEDPFLLKFLNKPIVEYYIDFCTIIGVDELRIVTDLASEKLREYCGDGKKWGISISYGLIRENDSLENVLLKNSEFCHEEHVFVIKGYQFIVYDVDSNDYTFMKNLRKSRIMKSGDTYLACIHKNDLGGEQIAFKECSVDEEGISTVPVDSVSQYFKLSMDILKGKKGSYVLPGYNNEPGVHIGQNVEIARNTKFDKPVMIGDKIRFDQLTEIGPNTVIGNDVIVDLQSSIKNSIIYDNTYIGMDLEIDGMIVYNNKLISGKSGETITIVDSFLISQLKQNLVIKFFKRIINIIIAAGLFCGLFIPFILFYYIGRATSTITVEPRRFFINKAFQYRDIKVLLYNKKNALAKLIFIFSLDKYVLLAHVFVGTLTVSGNKLLEVDDESREFITELKDYTPGVFNYSEIIPFEIDEFEMRMNEFYYTNHKSLWFDIKIALKAVVRRFIKIL